MKMMRTNLILLFLMFGIYVTGERVKRNLIFNKGSSLFFSVDVRDNLFDYSNFFAQVFGFKFSWTLPYQKDGEIPLERIQRRDLHTGLEYFLQQWGRNGKSGIEQLMCIIQFHRPAMNIFFIRLLEILFGRDSEKFKNSSTFTEDSENIFKGCPHSISSSNVTVKTF